MINIIINDDAIMVFFNSDNILVPPAGTNANGLALADEVSDLHLPFLAQHMVKPPKGSIVDQSKVRRLRLILMRQAIKSHSSNVHQRAYMVKVMTDLYNISPDEAFRVAEVCKAIQNKKH